MIEEKISRCFENEIALAVVSGLKKGAECEYSKVTVRPFASDKGVMYQLEYTVKNQVKHKNIPYEQLTAEVASLLENYFT